MPSKAKKNVDVKKTKGVVTGDPKKANKRLKFAATLTPEQVEGLRTGGNVDPPLRVRLLYFKGVTRNKAENIEIFIATAKIKSSDILNIAFIEKSVLELLVIDQKADSIIRNIISPTSRSHGELHPMLAKCMGDGDIYTVDKLKFEEIKACPEVFNKRMAAVATRCNDLNFALASKNLCQNCQATAEK